MPVDPNNPVAIPAPQAPVEPPITATPPAAPPSPAAPPQREVEQTARGQVTTIPHAAMARIRQEEYEKGRNEALQALAEAAGYSSHTEMVAALQKLKTGQAPAEPRQEPPKTEPLTPPAPGSNVKDDQRATAKYQRDLEKYQRDRDAAVARASDATRQVKELQAQLDAKDAEMALREVAVACGAKDVDYCLRLLTRKLETVPEAELQNFDERAYFDALKAEKPYLFGEATQPITTGTGTVATPPAPKPGATTQNGAKAGAFDARNAKPDEVQREMAKWGFNPTL